MTRTMDKIRLLFRTIWHGPMDRSELDRELAEARRRADHAFTDLSNTMEALTSGSKGKGK